MVTLKHNDLHSFLICKHGVKFVFYFQPNDVRAIETSQADGVIKCIVERPIISNDTNVFPLTESWYLLHAIGPVVPGELKHNIILDRV